MVVSEPFGHDQMEDYLEKGFIHCASIVEIAGAPKEHVEKTLRDYIEKLKNDDNGITVIKEDYSETKENGKLFGAFAEIEFLAKDASAIAFFCFDYMPSSIEIISPEQFTYRGVDFSGFFNDLAGRMHRIDRVVKELAARNKNLQRNANLLLRNLVLIALAESGPKDLAALSNICGIPKNQLQPFLEEMLKDNILTRDEGIFSLGPNKVDDAKRGYTGDAAEGKILS